MRALLRCDDDEWNHSSSPFPLTVGKYHEGLTFCPRKLWRDDPLFVNWCQELYLRMRGASGVPERELEAAELSDLYVFSLAWSIEERHTNQEFLARLLCGDDKKSKNPDSKFSGAGSQRRGH